jgi:hypothetical protein
MTAARLITGRLFLCASYRYHRVPNPCRDALPPSLVRPSTGVKERKPPGGEPSGFYKRGNCVPSGTIPRARLGSLALQWDRKHPQTELFSNCSSQRWRRLRSSEYEDEPEVTMRAPAPQVHETKSSRIEPRTTALRKDDGYHECERYGPVAIQWSAVPV